MNQEGDVSYPTIGEIGRTVNRVAADVSELRRELSQTYVRLDLYTSEKQSQGERIGEVAHDVGDVKADVAALRSSLDVNRRLAITALIGPIITGIVVGLMLQTFL